STLKTDYSGTLSTPNVKKSTPEGGRERVGVGNVPGYKLRNGWSSGDEQQDCGAQHAVMPGFWRFNLFVRVRKALPPHGALFRTTLRGANGCPLFHLLDGSARRR